ncbi:MAG: STAS/SEC14 domain-containing protein [Acetobacteraceae bacterium]
MITIQPGFPDNVVALACEGQVTRKDYDDILVPAVEAALARHQKLRLYYDIGPGFTGMDPGAMWEDFLVGMQHLMRWERVAVVTDVPWIAHTVNAFRFLMPGKVRVFTGTDRKVAQDWIAAADR